MSLGSLQGSLGQLDGRIADGGSDSGEVEPVAIGEDGVKIKLVGSSGSNGAVSAVINHVGSSHSGSGLQIVDSQSLAASGNVLGSNIVFS